ncbi:uncharacterized protein LOC100892940 [Strongylocentrotus purpuratus]|uniref:SH3 domain-containing protein n=1 Tax=Strongylocentrotus purpuratus TaxID=7668 RepID=A0A7M7HKF8_STRPU|nr:uncharacterized protein LOC100892940 [Strongylocentrotus purpuratus]
MPILCPGAGSLWKLGKHSRHGGQRSNSRHSSSGSRPVKARGTLAHPFTQKELDVVPPMSPGSSGGVYLGPSEKKEKVSSTTSTTTATPSAQDKKLAEIRSPTDYYTDGNVFIGQDVTKVVELDTKLSSERVDLLHPMRAEQSHHNDTLNPDGTLGSIVFFEETFMSAKFSHLTTSSPGGAANRSRTLDTTTASLHNWSGLHDKRNKESTIPSWVRQRRCLPTLDEVDFDQIDLISLHSLPTNESQQQLFSPDRTNGVRLQTVDEGNEQKFTVNNNVNNNWMNSKSKEEVSQPRSRIQHKLKDDHVSKNQRSVLGDLTNMDNSPGPKSTAKPTNQSAFYKIPKRASARERRSRRNGRTSNNRKIKPSSSRESLVNALDKPNEHTYVNLEYIAGIMTNSPPKEGSKKMNASIHDYESIWSSSPAKSAAVQRRMRHSLERSGQLGMSPAVSIAAKQNGRFSQNRRRSEGQRTSSKLSSKPDLFADLPKASPSPRMTPNSTLDRQNMQGALKSYMMGIKETVEKDVAHKKESRSSTSSWESATNSHSTEGEECAAILSKGAQTKPSHQQRPSRTIQQKKRSERNVRNSDDSLGRNGNVPTLNRQILDEGMYYIPKDLDTKRLVETPSFVNNAIRKARIVRTNSIEESSREVQDISAKPKPPTRHAEFKPKKSSHIEYRRSLPAPSTLNTLRPQTTPQRRSTTNVRAVEEKLSQKQNRKIRRTIEGDEVLEALLVQEQSEAPPQLHEGTKTKERCSESGETLPGEPQGRNEISRVQRIIEDWNQSSKRIAQRHASTHYVGGHIHTTSTNQLPDQKPPRPVSSDRGQVGTARVNWIKGARKNSKGTGNPRSDPRTLRTEVNQSSVRRIPTTYSSLPRTQDPRLVLTSPGVTEVYVTTHAYTPGEVDEVEAQRGEIVVVNSAMQRENDWMWVYVPRTDRFGYLPAFSARPLEFQVNEV